MRHVKVCSACGKPTTVASTSCLWCGQPKKLFSFPLVATLKAAVLVMMGFLSDVGALLDFDLSGGAHAAVLRTDSRSLPTLALGQSSPIGAPRARLSRGVHRTRGSEAEDQITGKALTQKNQFLSLKRSPCYTSS